jgi:predicted aspartyl protease
MSTSFPHRKDFFPPIPAVELGLRAPDGDQSPRELSGIIDTGADITLVPLALLEAIAAPEIDEVRLRSHWGEITTVTSYLVDIELGSDLFPAVEVVGDLHGDTVLLGRNVINKLLLLIDGPHQSTDLLARRPQIS